MSTYYVASPVLSALLMKKFYYPHFKDVEPEAHRS